MPQTLKDLGVIPEIKSLSLFRAYTDSIIENLFADSSVRICEHRETLFELGDTAEAFYVVVSGAFKLSKPAAGGEDIIIHFSTPGDVIAAFIMAQPHPTSPLNAVAMGPSRAIEVPKINYTMSWHKETQLIFGIQKLISSRMGALQNQKALLKAPLQAKVASLLIQLAKWTDSPNENEQIEISIPLTRKEIANSLGSTVESIIRIMSEWSKQGFISTNDHYITILRPRALAEFESLGS